MTMSPEQFTRMRLELGWSCQDVANRVGISSNTIRHYGRIYASRRHYPVHPRVFNYVLGVHAAVTAIPVPSPDAFRVRIKKGSKQEFRNMREALGWSRVFLAKKLKIAHNNMIEMERDTNTAPLNPLFWDYLVAVNDAINSVTIPANKAKYPKLDKTVTTSTY